MGKALGKVANIASLGLIKKDAFTPEQVSPQTANKSYFDIAKEVKPARQAYAPLLQASQASQSAIAPQRLDTLKQMALAASGQGPSLVEAQLKAAQDRNLAQQLAAVSAQRGGSAASNQRALLQNMGAAGRDIAQQAGVARVQERDNFLNQANLMDQNLRTDIQGKLNLDIMPKQALQNWENTRITGINQAQAQNAQMDNQLTGALLGGAASIAGASMGKKAEGGLVSKKDMFLTEKYKEGGPVKGPGTTKSDSIPTLLSDKEFVIKAEAVAQPGVLAALTKLNKNPEKYSKAFAEALAKSHTSKKGSKKTEPKKD
jgi:hypothetical protein